MISLSMRSRASYLSRSRTEGCVCTPSMASDRACWTAAPNTESKMEKQAETETEIRELVLVRMGMGACCMTEIKINIEFFIPAYANRGSHQHASGLLTA